MPLTPSAVTSRLEGGGDYTVGKCLQTTQGAINATPVFTTMRRKSGKTSKKVSYTQDESVDSTYQGLAQIQDGVELGVEIEANTSKQALDMMKEALYSAETIFTATASTFAATATAITVPAGTYAAISVGDAFWVTGFAAASLNTMYICSAKSGGNTLTTSIAPATTETAGASVTIKSTKYLNANNPYYNTFQTKAVDSSKGGGFDYHTIFDAVCNSFGITVPEKGIVSNKASYSAERENSGTAVISGQTYVAAGTDQVVSAVQNILGFYINDVSVTGKMKSISLDINLNQQSDDAAASTKRYTRGAFTASGSFDIRAFSDNPFLYRDYSWNGNRLTIGVRMTHGNGQESYIVIAQAVVTDAPMDDGNNTISNAKCSFGAEYNATRGYTVGLFTNW